MVNTIEISVYTIIMHQTGNKALVCVQKKDANLRSIFLNVRLLCSCTANWKASSENKKASSKECLLHIPIHSEMQCSFAYGLSGAAFMSSGALFVMAKWHRYRSGDYKCMSFFDAYHKCFYHPFNVSGTGTWNWWNVVGKMHLLDDHVLTMTVGLTQTCLNKMYSRFQFQLTIMMKPKSAKSKFDDCHCYRQVTIHTLNSPR